MKTFLEYLAKLPEWAVKIAFVVLVLLLLDMYIRNTRVFHIGQTTVGFLSKEQVQSEVIWLKGDARKENYPNGVHVNTTKDASCSEGYVVTAVRVVYGGTCEGKCNLDGGTVRQLELVCQRLRSEGLPVVKG